MVKQSIGYDVKHPEKSCTDAKCPFHGELSVRGTIMNGKVVSAKMQGTVIVERTFMHYVEKFERYRYVKRTYMAHSPPCIGAKEGDVVTIAECRPLSKAVSFVVIEKR
ncbi:MAG: 30S ribosomal protein S17 [Candidatus Thermoplasmatota archaeon]|jgi:small subunit ribosomal protein S17|nr:30S ribosomal protein S17 [Candidatus Thermoplasmatota archaeon]MCL5962998.1 30S ribosomal protein S17 [Candidatus Thermoplasmatota archaeon]